MDLLPSAIIKKTKTRYIIEIISAEKSGPVSYKKTQLLLS